MATITSGGVGEHRQTSRRSYITTSAFNNNFYKYTTSTNPNTFVITGALSAVTNVTAANCPANRILRENGKHLYPSAHPGITTYMVGVYDANSCLSGYIDPNAPMFAVYNTDKPLYIADGVDPATSLTDQGPPIYTRGSVTAGATVTAGTGGFVMPVNASVAATGSTNADAAAVTGYGLTVVTAADGTRGVILPTAVAGGIIYIKSTAGILKVYPAAGGTINALTATTGAYSTAAAGVTILVASSTTQWYTFPLVSS